MILYRDEIRDLHSGMGIKFGYWVRVWVLSSGMGMGMSISAVVWVLSPSKFRRYLDE